MTKAARKKAVAAVRQRAKAFTPSIGIILGSGLGGLADQVKAVACVRYSNIPCFPQGQIAGHAGKLVLGMWVGKNVAVMAGRFHFYQGFPLRDVTAPVRLLAGLGVKTLLVTNAAGGISAKLKPGDLMLIADHINFIGNPLVGELWNGQPIFQDMTQAYSLRLQKLMASAARREKITLKRGVYLACSGPSYETPAEVRAFAKLGADAAGMSTVPEVIEARAAGLEVCGLSCITNYAAGRTGKRLLHSEVLDVSKNAQTKMGRLIERFVSML